MATSVCKTQKGKDSFPFNGRIFVQPLVYEHGRRLRWRCSKTCSGMKCNGKLSTGLPPAYNQPLEYGIHLPVCTQHNEKVVVKQTVAAMKDEVLRQPTLGLHAVYTANGDTSHDFYWH